MAALETKRAEVMAAAKASIGAVAFAAKKSAMAVEKTVDKLEELAEMADAGPKSPGDDAGDVPVAECASADCK